MGNPIVVGNEGTPTEQHSSKGVPYLREIQSENSNWGDFLSDVCEILVPVRFRVGWGGSSWVLGLGLGGRAMRRRE